MNVAEKVSRYSLQNETSFHDLISLASAGSSEKEGLAKLRTFALDLAIRGKLRTSDPSDENATCLFNQIQSERNEYFAAHSIRSPRNRTKRPEIPFLIPATWKSVSLEELSLNIHYGYTASANPALSAVRMLRITDIQEGKVNWQTVPGCEIEESKIDQYRLQENDMLIARTGGTIGKTFLIATVSAVSVFASYLIRVVPSKLVSAEYLKLYFGTSFYWQQLVDKSAGTGQPNVNATSLKSLVVPLPPLAEQKRIVSKVDRLMGICDRLESQRRETLSLTDRSRRSVLASLTSSRDADELASSWRRLSDHFEILHDRPETLADLRQTILALAVQGKLTARLTDCEHASSILQATQKLRSELLDAKSVRKVKKPIEIEPAELTKLPDRWCWSRLGAILLDLRYGTSRKCEALANGVPVLRIPNVVGGNVDITHLKYTEMPEDEASELAVRPGDLLVIRSNGSQSIVGSATVITDEINGFAFAGYLVRLRIPTNLISAKYLQLALSSRDVRSQIEGSLRTTSGVKNVNSSELGNLLVPLPPLPEQELVVAKVDRLVAKCDRIAEQHRDRQSTIDQLLTATVHRILNDCEPGSS